MELVIKLSGGIGNQLFILFAGISKALDEKRDFKILIDKEVISSRPYYFDNYLSILKDKVIDEYDKRDKKFFHYKSHNCEMIPDNMDYIIGNFESYTYFEKNYEKIREIMKIDEFQKLINLNEKFICIHFRLGDFIDIPDAIILSIDYYINGIKLLQEKLGESFNEYKIIIFGNKENENFIKENMRLINLDFDNKLNLFLFNNIIKTKNDFEDFIFMSCCSHFIIANSTYSWMASYLATNKDKIIIHPPQYLHFSHNNESFGLYPKDNNYIEL
jgi:hypothetical protein